MSRQMRIEFPGALYHVIARGNCGSSIYVDEYDRYRFLELMSSTAKQLNLICHSYCLMHNHYHLLVETPDGNLSACMHRINSLYASFFNRKHDRIGHLFQARFKAIIVQRENYLLELCRYIVLNPVRAHIADDPSEYEWSSYRYTISLSGDPPPFLSRNWVLAQFDDDPSNAIIKFIRFVHDGIDARSPMEDVIADLVLGDKDFLESLRERTSLDLNDMEIAIEQRYLFRKELSELFGDPQVLIANNRNKIIVEACTRHGYTRKEVSQYLNLNRSTVGRIVRSGSVS